MNKNNSNNFNLQTGEEDDLAAILNRRNALTEKRRNLSSSNPRSHSFNSGSKAGRNSGRFGLGLSKSFNARLSAVSGVLQVPNRTASAGSKDKNEETRGRFMRGCSTPPLTPSHGFNSGSKAGKETGRYGLGLSKSFNARLSAGDGGAQVPTPNTSASSEETRGRLLRGCSAPPLKPTRRGRMHPSPSASFNSIDSNSLPPVAETDSSKVLQGGTTTKSSCNGRYIDLMDKDDQDYRILLNSGEHASSPLKRGFGRAGSREEEGRKNVGDSLYEDFYVIDLKHEDGHINNASSNSVGFESVAGDDKSKEEEASLHSQDDYCGQSSDGSGVVSSSTNVASSGIYSRFSGIFKGKRPAQTIPILSDSGTVQTHPDDDSDLESHATKSSASQYYTLEDHSDFLFLSAETNGWRYCDISPILTKSHIPKLVKDYISPALSFEQLKQAYFGVKRTLSGTDQGESRPEPLPIRTLAFRVRPDVPSQTIMAAVESSFSDIAESIVLTHQDGHYRCVMTYIPCIFDAQLCITTSEPFERTLLLRVYHAHDDEAAMEKIDGIVEPSILKDNEELMAFSTHLHLRQASSLVQLLSAENASPQTTCPKETPLDTSAHLMYKYESGPSVSEHTSADERAKLLPALSAKDWFIVQSSESLCIRVWKMLSKIDCVFHTISTTPLGGLTDNKAGSATIDPLFCLQLQQLCCEALMIDDLRATKDDAIEKHAWLINERYLNFLQVLNNTWKLYNIENDRPSYLPEEMPFKEASSTPDHVAIAAKVVAEYPHGLEKDGEVARASSKEDSKSPESAVDGIVRDVYAAYSKLNEEELRAYCKGKNAQIIARVNQIQKHEKEIIRLFENPRTDEMQSVAKEFSTLVTKVKQSKGDEVSDDEAVEVPILKVPSSGTSMCYITPSMIIYSTTGLLGKTLIFDFDAFEFEATSAAFMTVLLKNGERGGGGCKIWPSSLDVNHLTEFINTLVSLFGSL